MIARTGGVAGTPAGAGQVGAAADPDGVQAAGAEGTPAVGWMGRRLEAWADWRNRTVARPGFQRWATAFPLTRPLARREAGALFDLVAGFVYSQVLLACVRLQVFDLLAGGAVPVDVLAGRTGLSKEAAERLVAAAAALQLLKRRFGGRVALGRLGAPMVGNRAVAAMVEHHALLYGDLADPVALLRGSADPAMAGYWPYAAAGAGTASAAALPPERVATYSALMSASQPLIAQEVLGAHDFRRHRVLLDVGGGEGAFIAAVAQQAPQLQLLVFDLPAVAASARHKLAAQGLAHRARAVGGDFFEDPLPAGADIVSLVRVCFDHPDDRVLRLLKNVRRALREGGTVLLAEPLSDAPGAAAMGNAYFGFYLLAMGKGRPRSAADLSRLLLAAGFEAPQQLPTRLPLQCGVLIAQCRACNAFSEPRLP